MNFDAIFFNEVAVDSLPSVFVFVLIVFLFLVGYFLEKVYG